MAASSSRQRRFVMNIMIRQSTMIIVVCFFLVLIQFRKATNIQVFINNNHHHHHGGHGGLDEDEPSHLPPSPPKEDRTKISTSSSATTMRLPTDQKHKTFDNTTATTTTKPSPPRQPPHHHHHDHQQHLNKNESFGACLMVKDDNDLLYEWLAYHYTILPLRYVLVASDIGSTTNPIEVLRRWKIVNNTGLQYWSIEASDFTNRTTATTTTIEMLQDYNNNSNSNNNNTSVVTTPEDHHHAFIGRQRDFISYCVQFMKSQGLKWISLIDTDEYVVVNKIGNNENLTIKQQQQKQQHSDDDNNNNAVLVDPIYHKLRNHPSLYDNNKTILQIINDVHEISNLSPCYTMPRVLHGALTNYSCNDDESTTTKNSIDNLVTQQLNLLDITTTTNQFNTIQYHQHAKKGDFATSKFGKVFLDVSALPDDTVQRIPKNPHRPYKPECRPGVVYFPESLFYINHYLGSWERYSSRKNDGRRNKQEWLKRAYITTSTSCDKNITQWIPKFVNMFGLHKARYLLGG